jgi:hypothetical protein
MATYPNLDPEPVNELALAAGALAQAAREVLPLVWKPSARDELRALVMATEDALEGTRT